MTMLDDSFDPRPRGRRPSARFRFVVAFLVGVLAVLALGTGAIYAYDQQYAGRILPGVRVGSTELSGMTPDQAAAALSDTYRNLSDGRILVRTPDGQKVITYQEIGRAFDTEGLVADAMAVGRDGSMV